MKIKILALITTLSMLLSTACAPAGTSPSSGNQSIIKEPGAISIQLNLEPVAIDPAYAISYNHITLIKHIFAPLMEIDENGKPVPVLASDYTVSSNADGGETYTFTIAENAMWSNGDKVTAEDFVKSYQRILKSELTSPNAYQLMPIKNALEVYSKKLDMDKLGVRSENGKLVIDLTAKTDDFLERLSLPGYLAINRNALAKDDLAWGQSVTDFIASGKFIPTAWEKGSSITLEANPKYIKSSEVIAKKLNFVFQLSDEQTLKGEAMFSNMLPLLVSSNDIATKYPNKEYKSSLTMSSYMLEFNTSEKSVLSDVKLRQALALAIDRDSILSDSKDTAISAASLFADIAKVNGEKFFTPIYETTAAQMDRAKALLEESGKKGAKIKLVTLNEPKNVELMNKIKDAWTELGVDCTVVVRDLKAYQALLDTDNYDVAYTSRSSETLDPVNALSSWMKGSTSNYAKFDNPKYNNLMLAALKLKNIPEYADKTTLELLREAEKLLLVEEWAVFPISHYVYSYVADKGLTGYTVDYTGAVDFSKAVYVPST